MDSPKNDCSTITSELQHLAPPAIDAPSLNARNPPQEKLGQLLPRLSERLHSSGGEAPWNDRDGREPARDEPGDLCPVSTQAV
jgi:hypothetical protein